MMKVWVGSITLTFLVFLAQKKICVEKKERQRENYVCAHPQVKSPLKLK